MAPENPLIHAVDEPDLDEPVVQAMEEPEAVVAPDPRSEPGKSCSVRLQNLRGEFDLGERRLLICKKM